MGEHMYTSMRRHIREHTHASKKKFATKFALPGSRKSSAHKALLAASRANFDVNGPSGGQVSPNDPLCVNNLGHLDHVVRDSVHAPRARKLVAPSTRWWSGIDGTKSRSERFQRQHQIQNAALCPMAKFHGSLQLPRSQDDHHHVQC